MTITRPLSKQPIPEHAKKVFSGIIFDIYQWEQKLFDGSTATFEKAKRKSDSVNILPVTDDKKIILCKQEQPQEKPFIGAIGGRTDPGENPKQTAERELLEEAGIKAGKYELFTAVQSDIKVDWVCYTFIAKDIQKIQEQTLDAGEKIELLEVTFDDYMDIIKQPDYRDEELTVFFLKALQNKSQIEDIKKKIFS